MIHLQVALASIRIRLVGCSDRSLAHSLPALLALHLRPRVLLTFFFASEPFSGKDLTAWILSRSRLAASLSYHQSQKHPK
jgi:hypothetical protein